MMELGSDDDTDDADDDAPAAVDEEEEDVDSLEFDPLLVIKRLPPLESCVPPRTDFLLPRHAAPLCRLGVWLLSSVL